MTSAVAYLRISKDPEGRQAGIERQEDDIRALAARTGLQISQIFVDNDISASTLSSKRRPAFEDMMGLAEAGQIQVILAYSNSRLTRRPLELERLIVAHDRTGVEFRTVVSGQDDLSTADGRMVARIKASVDAAESERIGERTRRAKRQARADGRWPGGWRLYGFSADGQSVLAGEAAVLVEVTRALLNGDTITSLVRRLNDRGIPAATGRPWTRRTLTRVLLRPHPAIDEDVQIAVRHLLTDPSRRNGSGPVKRWLLSGFAHCTCGAPIRRFGGNLGHARGTYPAYTCDRHHVAINAVHLDGFIAELVVERLRAEPDVLQPPSADTSDARLELAALRTRLDALAVDLDVDERTLQRRAKALQDRVDLLEQRITAAMRATPLGQLTGRDPAEVWESATMDQRRRLLAAIVDDVIVHRSHRRGWVPLEDRWRPELTMFDPARVEITWRDPL